MARSVFAEILGPDRQWERLRSRCWDVQEDAGRERERATSRDPIGTPNNPTTSSSSTRTGPVCARSPPAPPRSSSIVSPFSKVGQSTHAASRPQGGSERRVALCRAVNGRAWEATDVI